MKWFNAARAVRVQSRVRTLGALAAAVLMLAPAVAFGQIYAWIDDKGGTVYSNVRPADTTKVKDFRVVAQEDKRPPAPPAMPVQPVQPAVPPDAAVQQAAQAEALRREQELSRRVAELERALQAQPYQNQVQVVAAAPPVYYENSYAGAYPSFGFPSFGYPPGYGVSYVIPTAIIAPRVIPSHFVPLRRNVHSGPVLVPHARGFGVGSTRILPYSVGSPRIVLSPSTGMGRGRH
jgi:hypothetical protein